MRYASIFIICILLTACKTGTKPSNASEAKSTTYSIDSLMQQADKMLGQVINCKGLVHHVCAHSGKRCILKNNTGDLSIRIEASGDLEGFDKEIAGNAIVVSGILREKRLDREYIREWESELKGKEAEKKEGEHCSAEMSNIKQMKEWMKENNKDYYAIYYIEGTGYEILE